MRNAEEVAAISLLLDPVRWRLYHYIRSSGGAVGRDEAARVVEVSRKLAAFHLDRMASTGLLTDLLASTILAAALEEKAADELPTDAARRVADRFGAQLGADLRQRVRPRDPGPFALAEAALEELGYEPVRQDGGIWLRNCPFHELAAAHRELTCAVNQALVAAMLPAVGSAELHAEGPNAWPGHCCVRITTG